MKYKAFISYKHEEKDTEVAKYLRKNIENFKIPKALRKQLNITSVGRVFRDTEELSTSSSLSTEIESALKESEFLLVICSPNTKNSRWVLQEIDNFIKFHDREHIIPILVEGEPDEAFPEKLCHYFDTKTGKEIKVEPLAADFRNMQKKNASNELLRVVARLIGCSYDNLKDRARLRKTRRRFTFSISALTIVAIIAITAIMGIIKTRAAYQKQLISQSRYLADTSIKLSEEGYTDKAILLALEALPKTSSEPDRPYVASAEYALSAALNTYGAIDEYSCIKSIYCNETIMDLSISNDNKYLLILTTINTLYVYSTKDYSLVCSYKSDSTTISQAGFTIRNDIYAIDDNNVYIIDLASGKKKSTYYYTDKIEDCIYSVKLSPYGDKIVLMSTDLLCIWDYDDDVITECAGDFYRFEFINNDLIFTSGYYNSDSIAVYEIPDDATLKPNKIIDIENALEEFNNGFEVIPSNSYYYENKLYVYAIDDNKNYLYTWEFDNDKFISTCVSIDYRPSFVTDTNNVLFGDGELYEYQQDAKALTYLQNLKYYSSDVIYYDDYYAIVPDYKSNYVCIMGKQKSTFTPIDDYYYSDAKIISSSDGHFFAIDDDSTRTIIIDSNNNKVIKEIDDFIPLAFINNTHKLICFKNEYDNITINVYDIDLNSIAYDKKIDDLESWEIINSDTSSLIAFIDSSNNIYVFDINNDFAFKAYSITDKNLSNYTYAMKLLNRNRLFYQANNKCYIYNLESNENEELAIPSLDYYADIAFLDDKIAFISSDFCLYIYDINTKALKLLTDEKFFNCDIIKFITPNKILTSVKEGTVEIINIQTGKIENQISISPSIMKYIQIISEEIIAIHSNGCIPDEDFGYILNISPDQNCVIAKIPHFRYYCSLNNNYYVYFSSEELGYFHKQSLEDLIAIAYERLEGKKLSSLDKQKYYIE